MKSRARVLIVGKGAFGEAIAELLYESHIFAKFYDRNPETNPDYTTLEEACQNSDIIFLAIPSSALPNVCEELEEAVSQVQIIIGLSKGINRFGTVADTIEHFFPKVPYGILSGPMLANEIHSGLFAGATIASKKREVRSLVKELFPSSHLILTENEYPRATALFASLKNIYAVGAGIITEKVWGQNVLGIYISQSIEEMKTIARIKGYPVQPLFDSGIADFIATSTSHHSCNVGAGKAIVCGNDAQDCEGMVSLPHLQKMLPHNTLRSLPLLAAISEVARGKDPMKLLEAVRFSKE